MVWDLALALRDCLCAELAGDPPDDGCCVVHGDNVALPNCCSMAWVRVVETYGTAGFPNRAPGTMPVSCDGGVDGWAAVVELGIGRCVATLDEYGNAPPCHERETDARRALADQAALLRAAWCCDWRQVAGLVRDERVVLGGVVPFGPQGGCAGSTLQVTVELCGGPCG